MISEAYDNDFGFTFTTKEKVVESSGMVSSKEVKDLESQIKKLTIDHQKQLQKLEKLILPLLRNLLNNPECEYIVWKDREEPIKQQIKKILEITQPGVTL